MEERKIRATARRRMGGGAPAGSAGVRPRAAAAGWRGASRHGCCRARPRRRHRHCRAPSRTVGWSANILWQGCVGCVANVAFPGRSILDALRCMRDASC